MIPCEPFITADVLPCDISDDPPASLATRAIAAASFVLWALGGRRHGICSVTVRPCAERCAPSGLWHSWGSGWQPVLYEGAWLNVCGCGSGDGCSCGPVSEIILPARPVASVESVSIDGVALVEGDDYRLDGSRLVRLDGEWPTCQNMEAAADAEGSFTVSFSWGTPVDALGQMAAGELACEFAKALRGDASCALPQRVQSITRQGVSLALLDPLDFLAEGRTGLYTVDLWLATVNPSGLASGPMVWSPDVASPRFVG